MNYLDKLEGDKGVKNKKKITSTVMTVLLPAALAAVTMSSFSTIAEASAQDCLSVAGDFDIVVDSEVLTLSVKVDTKKNTVTIDADGEGGEYIADGKMRKSPEDDSNYVAICLKGGGVVHQKIVHGHTVGFVTIEPDQDGVRYMRFMPDMNFPGVPKKASM